MLLDQQMTLTFTPCSEPSPVSLPSSCLLPSPLPLWAALIIPTLIIIIIIIIISCESPSALQACGCTEVWVQWN